MPNSSTPGLTPPYGSTKTMEQMLYLEIQRRSPEFPGEILAYAKETRRDLNHLLLNKEALLDFINEVLVKRTEQSWGVPPSEESVETSSSSQGSIYEAPLPPSPQMQHTSAPQYYINTPTHPRYVYVQRPQSYVYYYYQPVQPVKVVTPSVFYM